MRPHLILKHTLLIILFSLVFAEEDGHENMFNSTNNTTTENNEDTGAAKSSHPAPLPQVSPSASPTFLLTRPLHNMQVTLLGTYNSSRREELLGLLQFELEKTLYGAMVNSFVPESDKETFLESRNNSSFNKVNVTEQDLLSLSILSKVSLEWIVTNFKVDGDPNYHNLQASGSLGFTRYDYNLMHPQTILPLQEQVMAENNATKVELVLLRKNFYFQVLQFITVDPDEEDVPMQAPTIWELDGEDIISDLKENSTLYGQTDDDGEGEPFHEPVGDASVRIALIVACTVSVVAFVIFMRFVCYKSKQLKRDLMLGTKQRHSVTKGGVLVETDIEKKNHGADKFSSFIVSQSTSSETPTSCSSPALDMSSSSVDSNSIVVVVGVANEADLPTEANSSEYGMVHSATEEADVAEVNDC